MSNHGKTKSKGPGSSGRKKAAKRMDFEKHMEEVRSREGR